MFGGRLHECCVDGFVVAEARRNLQAKGPAALEALNALLADLHVADLALSAQRTAAHAAVAWLPEKDRPVLAAAIALRCDALVTGDRTHFGSGYGRAFGGVTLYSPRALAEKLLA